MTGPPNSHGPACSAGSSHLELLHGLGRQAERLLVVLRVCSRSYRPSDERRSDLGVVGRDLRHAGSAEARFARLLVAADRRIPSVALCWNTTLAVPPAWAGIAPQQVLPSATRRNRVHVRRLAADGLRPSADDDRDRTRSRS
jgi:hypothetical protein